MNNKVYGTISLLLALATTVLLIVDIVNHPNEGWTGWEISQCLAIIFLIAYTADYAQSVKNFYQFMVRTISYLIIWAEISFLEKSFVKNTTDMPAVFFLWWFWVLIIFLTMALFTQVAADKKDCSATDNKDVS